MTPPHEESATEIREYVAASDAAGLRTCFVELQDFERGIEPALPAGEAVADAYLERMLERCTTWDGAVFVAVAGARVVGFVCLWARVPPEPDEPPAPYAFVSDLVVAARWRRRGIGRRLLDAAEHFAHAHGAGTLKLDVLDGNAGARRVYANAGFATRRLELMKALR